jgi:hypothetical protein
MYELTKMPVTFVPKHPEKSENFSEKLRLGHIFFVSFTFEV